MMKTNAEAVQLIKDFEGFVPKWYRDPVGVWTIGYGHTDSAGSPKWATSKTMVLSEAEGTAILQRDLGQYEDAVARLVKVPLNENQHGALVSFTYNLGAGNLGQSTLLRKLNAGDYAGAAVEFARWNKAGGKVLNGLVRRRAAERALFEKPVSVLSSVRYPKGNKSPVVEPAANPFAAFFAFLARIFGGAPK